MLACLALLEVLAYAEYDLESCRKGELCLLDELLVSLTVILAALGMAEYGVFTAGGLEHVD